MMRIVSSWPHVTVAVRTLQYLTNDEKARLVHRAPGSL
jgi:hypothetical protein